MVAADPTQPWAAAELEWHLHQAGLSTAFVVVPGGMSTDDGAAHLQKVAARLRFEGGPSTLVQYSGVGRMVPAAMRAAHQGRVGAVAWRPCGAPGDLVPAAWAPSLVVVHLDQGRSARRAGRRLTRQMGSQSRLAVLWADVDPLAEINGWVDATLNSAWPVAEIGAAGTSQRATRVVRKLAIPGALAVGAGTMLLPAATAGASTRAGQAVSLAQRAGDGLALAGGPGTSTTKKNRFTGHRVSGVQRNGDVHSAATGSVGLTDKAGMKWFVNTNVSFSTSSSASGGMSEASFQHAVAASTVHGGTTQSTLNDAYDGYNSLCISVTNATGTCETGNANWNVYNKTGAAPTPVCNSRQLDFPVQAVGNLRVSRQVYVPSDDHFARWLNSVTNTGTSAQTITMATGNNLGSDTNTVITGSSSGDKTATTADDWVTTFQNYTGSNTTTTDPRLGHVLEGPGAKRTGLGHPVRQRKRSRPWWDYKVTIGPGQTVNILNFGVADGTIAESMADSARLDALPAVATECMSVAEEINTVNFSVGHPAEAGATTATPDGKGDWVASPTGVVKAFGDATLHGSPAGIKLAAPIVGIESTPDGNGYWLVGSDGGVFAYGDARFFGSAGGVKLHRPISGIADTPDGKGYWLVGTDGGVFAYGDAGFHGSTGGANLAGPVVDLSPTRDGKGYWLVGSDGGVFNYGNATYHGSLAGVKLAKPVVGIAPTPDATGYWMVASDGGVFALGTAKFYGSTSSATHNQPTVGMVISLSGMGYQEIRADGGSNQFGDNATS